MDDIISVIVPIYNVEDYLEECVRSIIEQTYKDIEIILVDDGSTDNSGKICDDFMRQDTRIKVIHKQNGGNTSARKAGLVVATGKFLLYVDSDDWIDPNMCQFLLQKMKECQADIVRCALLVEEKDKKTLRKDGLPEGVYKSEDELKYLYDNLIYCSEHSVSGTNNSLCTQLVKKELVVKMYEEMSEKIQYGEDMACVIVGMLHADVVCITHTPLYHYRMREGSITHSSNDRYYEQINSLYLYLKKIFCEHPSKNSLLQQLERLMDELVLRGLNERFIIPRVPRIPKYMFPMEVIQPGTKIVLYGAGAVGKAFHMQLKAAGMFDIVAWVDKDYESYQKCGLDIQAIDTISGIDFDYILIAVKDEKIYKAIKVDLQNRFALKEEKLIWERPLDVFAYFKRGIIEE